MEGVLHTILAGSNVGILLLATAAFFTRFLMGASRSEAAVRLDQLAFGAAAAGFFLAIPTILTGLLGTWSLAAIGTTLLAQNKILAATALLAAFGMFSFLRWREGSRIWEVPRLKFLAAVLMLVGFINLVLVGSMGGSASLKGTILDPLFLAVGINKFVTLTWGLWINIALIVLTVIFVAYAMAVPRGRRR